ncbi:MAG TPA: DUF1874 domain-containing protein [Syntrophales bacterium]|nr:DUF1874 domain-containing protein [Syntrophales bacterium]HOO00960.1 DUF1874 domain-containing protein [Syntrophales bacterium]
MTTYVLNTPVLTDYGTYRFERVDLSAAQEMAKGAVSAVGHAGAAEAVSLLLGRKIQVNRTEISMKPGDVALVFRVLARLPEGAVLSAEETLALPHEFGRLERLA